MKKEDIIALLKAEVLPTSGCTEPGAVALAAAHAGKVLAGAGEICRICVAVNANIYKNGVAVGIPGTGETGLPIAAALGVLKKCPEKQLAVLSEITSAELAAARQMVEAGMIEVSIDETKTSLWICLKAETKTDSAEVVIADYHTQVMNITRNGNNIFHLLQDDEQEVRDVRQALQVNGLKLSTVLKTIEAIDVKELEFVLEGVEMNLHAAETGIGKKLGMGLGALYEKMTQEGILSDDAINYAKKLTAAAADARMSGENIPVMSSAGSGNHGITATLPVYAVAQKLNVSREQLIRAIALSHIITIYVKIRTGNLSALCGCAVAAATGATAGIAWLSGGKLNDIESAMKNLIANLTGMICDGGKVGCALKLSTAAAAAVESSILACAGIVVPNTNGIIAETIEGTIENLGKVSNPGMLFTDKVIIDVILEKRGKAALGLQVSEG